MKKRVMRVYRILLLSILCIVLTGCGRKAENVYHTAMEQYTKGDYEAAAKNFQKAIKLRDDYAQYYIDYGFCLTKMQDYEQADKMFDKVILKKKNKIVNKNNKQAYRGKGIVAYMQGDYENAIKNFKTALDISSLNSFDMDIVSYMSNTYLQLGDQEQAKKLIDEVLKKEPKNVAALVERAQIYAAKEDFASSIKDYDAALASRSNDFSLYFAKYNALQAMGDEEQAKAVLTKASAIKVKKNDITEQFYKEKINYLLGMLEDPKTVFEDLATKGVPESYYLLGDIAVKEKDYTAAQNYYETYLSKGMTADASFYNKLGSCYLNAGKYPSALDMFDKGTKLANVSDKQELLRNTIVAYEHMGDYKKAYSMMKEYLKEYKDDADAKRDYKFLKTRQS